MKKSEAKVIFVLVAIMVIVLIIVIANRGKDNKNEEVVENIAKEEFIDVKEDGTRVNTSNKLAETKKYDGLEISNITLTEKGNESYIRATVKNTTSVKKGEELIKLTIVDKQGNVLTSVKG